jgi:N-acetylneuraminic acid mutarotase
MKRVFVLLMLFAPLLFAKQQSLSFSERVLYQRAIEEVYWKHRIWPRDNPQPKPGVEGQISNKDIARKVDEYLRKSVALEQYWQRPIRQKDLQAEMDRIVTHSKDPEVLKELFYALQNDPYLIAECLARPLLVDRFTDKIQGFENWWLENRKNIPLLQDTPHGSFHLTSIQTGGPIRALGGGANSWINTSVAGSASRRRRHTAIWTGTEMIVWGGEGPNGVELRSGGKYNPVTDSWSPTTLTGAPQARENHTAIWTGTEMIIWGGQDNNFNELQTGGRYNPSSNTWLSTNTNGAPSARTDHTAVWTGNRMVIWGGGSNTGGLTGVNTGGLYNPITDSWTDTETTGAPSGRIFHSAVWTGTEMIVWGGRNNTICRSSGGRYDPSTNVWLSTNTSGPPSGRCNHKAVWTGAEMIIWGGAHDDTSRPDTGGRYYPATDSWLDTSTINAPAGRDLFSAVWTGSAMIVWGGQNSNSLDLRTGGLYSPSTDSWTKTKLSGAPSARQEHTAVWTGTQMIVWGGVRVTSSGGIASYLRSGGRYTP